MFLFISSIFLKLPSFTHWSPSLQTTNLWLCTSQNVQIFSASSASPALLYSTAGLHPNTSCNCYPFLHRPLASWQLSHLYHFPPVSFQNISFLKLKLKNQSYHSFLNMLMFITFFFFNVSKITSVPNQILSSPLLSVEKNLPNLPKHPNFFLILCNCIKHCCSTLQQGLRSSITMAHTVMPMFGEVAKLLPHRSLQRVLKCNHDKLGQVPKVIALL